VAHGTVVFQIGTSSGREISWLASQYPKIRFVGTDIYENVVAYAAESHNLPNLQFCVSPAHLLGSLIQCAASPGNNIIFSSGSLQYVQPEHLVKLFANLSSIPNKTEVYLEEPGCELNGAVDQLEHSLPRGN
jgi:trans-aconitate methyltransferase